MKKLILILILICSTQSYADDFSDYQVKNLKMAYNYGKKSARSMKRSNADQIGYVMAAIMWKESTAGINCGRNGDAIGAFQTRTSTIQQRLRQNGIKKSHNQIERDLMVKSESAKWAYEELNYWLGVHDGNMKKAVASYNAGWNISKGMKYSASVLSKANYLKSNGIIE